MPARGRLTIKVYDVLGRLVARPQDGVVEVGNRTVAWRPGHEVASGVYFFQVRSDFGSRTIKTALVR